MSFWNIIWFIFVSFAFIAYLMFMFQIIGDLFRDHTVSGWVKALWMICLIFFPFLTAIIYLVVRGKGMYERQSAAINAGPREPGGLHPERGRPRVTRPTRSPRPRVCSTPGRSARPSSTP